MSKLKYDFIDAHDGMRQHKAGDEASGISKEGMAFLKEKGYLEETGKAAGKEAAQTTDKSAATGSKETGKAAGKEA